MLDTRDVSDGFRASDEAVPGVAVIDGLLEKAFEVHDPSLPYIALCPVWDPVRSEPRFQDFLRRMNLPTMGARSDPDEQG